MTDSSAPFRIEQLADHDRAGFTCGQPSLDSYFQNQVTQDIKRHIANCFVAVEAASGQVVGFYTLAAASIVLDELPPETSKRLPKYPTVPAVRIGRMAVASSFQRRGLGDMLLADAAQRVIDSDVAAFALTVDSKDDQATAFYRQFGFLDLVTTGEPTGRRSLFIAVSTVKKI